MCSLKRYYLEENKCKSIQQRALLIRNYGAPVGHISVAGTIFTERHSGKVEGHVGTVRAKKSKKVAQPLLNPSPPQWGVGPTPHPHGRGE